ncbi:MFS transporter [Kitasatospora sp. NPDC001539]|uniref:MFS transporter n=1 Tax=Kitasatospora sp. NPDC001539 TaxID=3154384 RepID=UPI0033188694
MATTQLTTPVPRRAFPLPSLLALATAVFVTALTENLPAGVLPGMSRALGVSESAAGQTVTVYAIGSAVTAIPLTAATAAWSRKRLLLTAMAGFAVANTVTALSANYPLTLAARFLAGVAAGLAWALLAGYARRLVPVESQGRAMAVAMAGVPVALSVGVPVGTFLGRALAWRVPFLAMTALAVAVVGWIAALLPDQPPPGRSPAADHGRPEPDGGVRAALHVPGVAPVLTVTVLFVLAHTILFTYVSPFLDRAGLGGAADSVLLVFGLASLVSVWLTGVHIHRRLRRLTIGGALLVALTAGLLGLWSHSAPLVHLAALLWGLGWGGAPTLLQTAVGDAGGERADAAQAMLVTLWNAAMAGGGVLGGLVLGRLGTGALPWTVLALLLPVLAVTLAARRHGFPATRGRTGSGVAGPQAGV